MSKKLLFGVGTLVCVIILVLAWLTHTANLARSSGADMPMGQLHGNLHGRLGSRIASAQEEIRHDPDNPQAHSSLAGYYDLNGERAKAIVEYQQAVRLDPKDRYNSNMLAHLLVSVGRREEGRAIYEKLVAQGSAGAKRNLQEMDAMKNTH